VLRAVHFDHEPESMRMPRCGRTPSTMPSGVQPNGTSLLACLVFVKRLYWSSGEDRFSQ
jgi:hypothetical protein